MPPSSYALHMAGDACGALLAHLIADGQRLEEAAFAFAVSSGEGLFRCVDWRVVSSDGYRSRSRYRIELRDEVRADVIRRAHDLGAAVAEFHSHLIPPARFSATDWDGFREWVPHVQWRLPGRPYFAVVVTARDLDGLVWPAGSSEPRRLGGVVVDGRTIEPTRLSALRGGK